MPFCLYIFLPVTVDFRAVLSMMRAGHALQSLIAHHTLNQILARLEAEDLVLEIDVPGATRVECLYGSLHDLCSELAAASPAFMPAFRNAPGFGASFGRPA